MGHYTGSALADYLYKQRHLNVTSSAMANFEIYGTSYPTFDEDYELCISEVELDQDVEVCLSEYTE